MTPNGNILALFHDGYFLADIAGGIRAAHQDGRSADFRNGTPTASALHAAYMHDDMSELHMKVVAALDGGQQ
ncbi:hypothetical protein [Bordetella trematum]|uniref:hypothetical protein n=1 Tax=Bordetella trematum TaxID=123899 RepID=UPI003AF39D8D